MISNFKNYDEVSPPRQYILKYEGEFNGHHMMHLNFSNYSKYLFKIKNLIQDPTYTIKKEGNIEYIIYKADIENYNGDSVYKNVKIYYILNKDYKNHYAIQNWDNDNKFLKIEEDPDTLVTSKINFKGVNEIKDVLNSNQDNKIQNPYMFKIHIEGESSEVYVKTNQNYYKNSTNIYKTRNIFINDSYAKNLLLSREFGYGKVIRNEYGWRSKPQYGVLQYIKVRYTEREDDNNGNKVWFDFRETPIFKDCSVVTLWVHSVRKNSNYIMHFWKHGYKVSYGNGTENQLYTDQDSHWLRDKPNNITDYLGFGHDCDWHHYFKKDDILLFWPGDASFTDGELKNRTSHELVHGYLNNMRQYVGRYGHIFQKWLSLFPSYKRRELALNITNNESFYKDN